MLCFAASPTRRKSSVSPIVRSMFSPAWEIFPRCRMTDCAYKFITAACCFVMNFKPTPPKGGVALLCFAESPTRRKLSASPTARSMFSPAWAIFPRCRMTDCACKFITATCCFVMNFNPIPPRGVGLLYFSASPTRMKSSVSPIARSMFSPAWEIFPCCRMTDCINSPAQILRGAVFCRKLRQIAVSCRKIFYNWSYCDSILQFVYY